MRPYADAGSNELRENILAYAAPLIEQYMPKYPLDGLLLDGLLRWRGMAGGDDGLAGLGEAHVALALGVEPVSGR
jgi:hypothetical protein